MQIPYAKTPSNAIDAPPKPGNITAAQRAGFPGPLLLPICPADATGMPENMRGKAPACFKEGRWKGLLEWNHGTSPQTREESDAAGANCGLILGVQNHYQQYVAVDGDMFCGQPGEPRDDATMRVALEIRAVIIDTVVSNVGPVWVRNTREGRCAILLRLPPTEPAGSKAVINLTHPLQGDAGKVELLSKNQQIVVCGLHPITMREAEWWHTDAPSEMFRVPQVDGIVTLKDRAAVDELLERIREALEAIGITTTWTKTKEHDPANSNHTSPADQAAPSIGALLELLRGLPNPASASRVGIYLSVMHGAAGCVRAARTLTPKITKAEEAEVAHEAASWAARWESGNSASYQFERDKFNDDFLKSGTVFSGWRTLLLAATELGFTDASYIDAAEEFEAVHMTPEQIAAAEQKAQAAEKLRVEVEKDEERRKQFGPRGRVPSVQFLKLKDIEELPPQEWLVDDLVPAMSLVSPYGAPKAYKTFLLLSMGLHIATGRPWMNKATKQGAIVYIVGEGARGLQKRLEAMKKHYGITNDAPFYVIGRAVNFMNKDAVRMLVEDIEDLMVAEGQTLAAVMVDTVARAIPGADENAVKEMGIFILGCDQLREHLKCTVFAIHHAGKDLSRGARGSNSLLGAVDAEYVIEQKKGHVGTLTVSDMRDGESGEVMTFDMLKIGTSDGKSTLVPVLRAAAEVSQGIAPHAPPKLAGDQELAFGALEEALRTTGEDRPSGIRICTVEAWRRIYYSKRGGDEPDAKKKGFKRSRTALLGKGLIDVNDPYVWVRTAWSDAGEFTATAAAEMAVLLSATPPSSGLN